MKITCIKQRHRGSFSIVALVSFVVSSIVLTLASCNSEDDFTPKPSGYFRITFPEKKYQKYDTICPFTFDYPVYAVVSPDKERLSEPCWLNIDFPEFKGRIHFSYKPINNNLNVYLDDAYELVSKHKVKASGIEEIEIKNDTAKVYGLAYTIKGNAASSLQFFITDSTSHFVRGALYFNAAPNGDSIAPVVDFISKDVYRFLNTFRWKNQ